MDTHISSNIDIVSEKFNKEENLIKKCYEIELKRSEKFYQLSLSKKCSEIINTLNEAIINTLQLYDEDNFVQIKLINEEETTIIIPFNHLGCYKFWNLFIEETENYMEFYLNSEEFFLKVYITSDERNIEPNEELSYEDYIEKIKIEE